MSTEKTQAYCHDCDRRVLAERKGTSHILHLLLTVLTFGLWLPVWIGSSIKFGGWRCPICGGSHLEHRSIGNLWQLPK